MDLLLEVIFLKKLVDRKILYWNVGNETLFGESAKLTRDLIWYELFFMISWFFNLHFLGIYNKSTIFQLLNTLLWHYSIKKGP